ncbi:MAG: hypothetical protein MZV70_47765 [Desulfobacterales bacterium]|nr:hypothetical protein [Desulfobacterales bacterium]
MKGCAHFRTEIRKQALTMMEKIWQSMFRAVRCRNMLLDVPGQCGKDPFKRNVQSDKK